MYSDGGDAIVVDNISKCYRIYEKPSDRLKQAMPWQRRKLYKEYWALREVSLRLKRGKSLGIIGQNGSGKSTLLQIICGTIYATSGSIEASGRICALLELGSGFNPEFSGIENIRLNAAILGVERETVERQLDSIISFADIGDYISQPVKCYSSGMLMRVAFAVQAHLDPSILIVDEALAVGDELFQKKCFSRLESLKEKGTSVLLDSDSCSQVNQHCDEVMLLHKGRCKIIGDSHRVTTLYQRLLSTPEEEWDKIAIEEQVTDSGKGGMLLDVEHLDEERIMSNVEEVTSVEAYYDQTLKSKSRMAYPARGINIKEIKVITHAGEVVNTIPHGLDFIIELTLECQAAYDDVRVSAFICNKVGKRIAGVTCPRIQGKGIMLGKGVTKLGFNAKAILWPGIYFIGAGVSDTRESGIFYHRLIDDCVLRVNNTARVQSIGDTDISGTANITISTQECST